MVKMGREEPVASMDASGEHWCCILVVKCAKAIVFGPRGAGRSHGRQRCEFGGSALSCLLPSAKPRQTGHKPHCCRSGVCCGPAVRRL